MSGHSKWAQIKHKKATSDVKRSAAFTKICHIISVAARAGGPDPETNFRLRLALEKARKANLPQSNIDHAIQKATKAQTEQNLEEIVLEIIGPSDIALIAKGITDNKNRTLSEVKHILSRYGFSLGSKHSVGWKFSLVGEIKIPTTSANQEKFTLQAIDAGAQDVQETTGALHVYTAVPDLDRIKKRLSAQQIPCESMQIMYLPHDLVQVHDPEKKEQLAAVIEELNENADITELYLNVTSTPSE